MRDRRRPAARRRAGGFARETVEAVRAINAVRPTWNAARLPRRRPGRGTAASSTACPCSARSSSSTTSPRRAGRADHRPSRQLRQPAAHRRPARPRRRALRDDRAPDRHASARTCTIGAGSVLLAHVDLTADVSVGRHVVVMPQVVLPHDVRVDDFATLASGVRVGGACHVARGRLHRRRRAVLREGTHRRRRGRWSGMGSVVTRDVPARAQLDGLAGRATPAPPRCPTLMRESRMKDRRLPARAGDRRQPAQRDRARRRRARPRPRRRSSSASRARCVDRDRRAGPRVRAPPRARAGGRRPR